MTYNVKRSLVNGGPYTSVSGALAGTSYTDPGLTNGLTYYYRVSAVTAGCESTNSLQVSATPACTPPPAPAAANNCPALRRFDFESHRLDHAGRRLQLDRAQWVYLDQPEPFHCECDHQCCGRLHGNRHRGRLHLRAGYDDRNGESASNGFHPILRYQSHPQLAERHSPVRHQRHGSMVRCLRSHLTLAGNASRTPPVLPGQAAVINRRSSRVRGGGARVRAA